MLSQFARSACRRAAAPARRAAAARAYAAEGGANGGSHSDFAPQSAAGEDADVQARIAEMVEGDDVVLFMKGTPNAPQCGFSNMACRVLELYDVKFTVRVALHAEDARTGARARLSPLALGSPR